MQTQQNIGSALRLTEQGLALRKQFLCITRERVEAIVRVADILESVAPQMIREFYDFQFQFPETLQFFTQYAKRRGVSLQALRQQLEQAQLQYFLEILREARRGGAFGSTFLEQRLHIGYVHNEINLPMKWYLGSYALYAELLKKHLLENPAVEPTTAQEAFTAILSVFLYDIQAVCDAFIVMLLRDLCVCTEKIQVDSSTKDLTDYFGDVRRVFGEAIKERFEQVKSLTVLLRS